MGGKRPVPWSLDVNVTVKGIPEDEGAGQFLWPQPLHLEMQRQYQICSPIPWLFLLQTQLVHLSWPPRQLTGLVHLPS